MATNPRTIRHSRTIICSPPVVVMQRGETKEQAWEAHVKKHPEDIHTRVRIFHFIPHTTQDLVVQDALYGAGHV